MSSHLISTQSEFDELVSHLRTAGVVAFDTEFLSEFTYRPQLCLLQFATAERAALVDPLAVPDLSAWWQLMASGEVLVVVHGSREEIRFCLQNAQAAPRRLYDVQIAEALQCRGFPLGYSALVARVLKVPVSGKETRTDWRRRPLTDRQVQYALEDVQHLIAIYEKQTASLGARGRLTWAQTEIDRYVRELEEEPTRENWRKLPGVVSLSRRELAVAREVYLWREQEAASSDKPFRRILRDDLIIELARRQPVDVPDLLATRDMNRSDYRRLAPAMLGAIQRGLAIRDADLPTVRKNDKDHDEQILAQLLNMALANRCAEQEVALGLVGTTADLRHLVRWHVYGDRSGPPPKLTQGWRAELCGELLTDVLDGRIALRVNDPKAEYPLVFERLNRGPRDSA
jgi:ribonuclease D